MSSVLLWHTCCLTSHPLPSDERKGNQLQIGSVKMTINGDHQAAALIPDVLFFDNQQVQYTVCMCVLCVLCDQCGMYMGV